MDCGDGMIDVVGGELCDDGNTADGDGCDNACNVEAGYRCDPSPTLLVAPVGPWISICYVYCGDGIITPPEACDDGNPFSGDGCSGTCVLESAVSWTCVAGPGPPDTVCTEACDGVNLGGFECEDGNAVNGDGCLANCGGVEAGFSCTIPHECEPH